MPEWTWRPLKASAQLNSCCDFDLAQPPLRRRGWVARQFNAVFCLAVLLLAAYKRSIATLRACNRPVGWGRATK